MPRPISALRALLLLLSLRLRRFVNGALHGTQPARGAGAGARRPFKRTCLLLALATLTCTPLSLLIGDVVSRQRARAVVEHLVVAEPGHEHLETVRMARITKLPEPAAAGAVVPATTLATHHLVVIVLLLFVAITELASTRIEPSSPDLEVAAALPIAPTTVYVLRVIDQALLSLLGVFEVAPGLAAIAWACGYRWAAVPLALALTPLLVLPFVQLRIAGEVELRARFGPRQLRNAKAALLVCASAVGMGAFVWVAAVKDPELALVRMREAVASWMWLPPGLAVQALAASEPRAAAAFLAALFAQALVVLGAGAAFIHWRTRAGIDPVLERESARSDALPPPGERRLLTPMQAKLFTRLARDWSFLTATLLGPVLVAGFELVPFWSLARIAGIDLTPARLVAAGLAISAWLLHSGLLHALVAERDTLWLLSAMPRRIERGVAELSMLWFAAGAVPVAAFLALAVRMHAMRPLEAFGWAALALAAHLLMVAMAACCTMLDGTEVPDMPQTRNTARYGVLFLNVALPLLCAIFSGRAWFIGVVFFVDAMLLWAVADRVQDRAPYFLDPSAEPPRGITLFDALLAANVYFQVQSIAMILLHAALGRPPEQSALIASTAACFFTIAFARAWLDAGAAEPPRWRGPSPTADLALGAVLALVCTAVTVPAISYACQAGWIAEFPRVRSRGAGLASLIALAVVIAPIVEEFLFRGMVHAGVRKMTGALSAIVTSALLFACVHPPQVAPAALVVGLAAAVARERTGALAAGIAMHAIYNALMLAVQM